MLLDPAGAFVITDNYALNGYGEIGLAAGTTPLVQPTAVGAPGSPEAAAQADATIAELPCLRHAAAAGRVAVLDVNVPDEPVELGERQRRRALRLADEAPRIEHDARGGPACELARSSVCGDHRPAGGFDQDDQLARRCGMKVA